jgi:hypothetical protein
MRLVVIASIFSLFTGCFRPKAPGDPTRPDSSSPPDMMSPAQKILSGGLLQSVSSDQTQLAYLSSTTTVGNVVAGSLLVTALPPSGQSRAIADNAWAAAFGGTPPVLAYLSGPTPSIDGTTSVFGALNFWTPGMSAAARLSTGFAPLRALAPSNAWALFWDTAAASVNGAGDVKLARAGDCTASTCAPITLAPAVSSVVSVAAAPDGERGAYVIKNAGSPSTFDVFLVTISSGATARVVKGGSSSAIAFSTDGALFAAVGSGGALVVLASATGAPTTWAAPPTGSKTSQVGFADAARLLVRATPVGASSANAYTTTATAATLLASGIAGMELPHSGPKGEARFVVLNSSATSGVGDMTAYDLKASAPVGLPLATMASTSALSVSFDQTYVRLLESFDSGTQTGTLTMVSLIDGSKTTIAGGVSLSSPAFVGAHTLFYFDSSGTLTSWLDAATVSYAGGVEAFRVRSSNLYFSVGSSSDDLFGYAAGIYTQPLDQNGQ